MGGSAEVLKETLEKLTNDKVKVRVIHSGVGAINESDILLASASNAIVIGFNVRPERTGGDGRAGKVDVRFTPSSTTWWTEMKKAMSGGLLAPVFKEVCAGRPKSARRSASAKWVRWRAARSSMGRSRATANAACCDNVVVHTGKIGSLRRFKDDVSEVKDWYGVRHHAREILSDLKPGDIIEAFATDSG